MKKNYVRPMMVGERFAANEYVAACGDNGKIYKFKCNAPGGILYYYPKSDGNIDGEYKGDGQAQYVGSYTPCSATHEAPATTAFYDGFVDRNFNGTFDSGENVIVWRGPNGRNGHATANLKMDTWETARS